MFYLFNIEVIIEQIDGANGGYPSFTHRYEVVAKTKELATAKAVARAKFEHRELLCNKAFVTITRAAATGREVLV